MLTVVPSLFSFFSRRFRLDPSLGSSRKRLIPSAPTAVGIILVFTFQSISGSRARFWDLSSSCCSSTYSCVSQHCDICQECRLVVLLYDYNGHLYSITWSVCILTSQRTSTFSVSITGSTVCRYRCSNCVRAYFSHRLQWTILATLLILHLCQLAAFTR